MQIMTVVSVRVDGLEQVLISLASVPSKQSL